MISIFKRKPKDVTDPSLGPLRYTDDGTSEYWEVLEVPDDPSNLVSIDFATVAGLREGPDKNAIVAFSSLLEKPEKLWGLVDSNVVGLVANEIEGISVETLKEHFHIRSLTVDSVNKYEVGFQSNESDIFIELFVEDGAVSNMEKDVG